MVNFVRPCAKLIEKTRDGARMRRRYDRPHTPCQRVLACEQVPEAVKQRLRKQFAAIHPIALNDQIVHLQRRLLRLAAEHASPLTRFQRAGRAGRAGRCWTSPRLPSRNSSG